MHIIITWYAELCTGCSCQVLGSTEERVISFGSGYSIREGFLGGFPVVKNPPASAGDIRDTGLIPGSGRSPGGGRGNPLQYSCLETPLDRGAEWTRVQTVTESRTRLKRLSIRASSRELSQPMCAQSGLVTHCHSQSPVFPACFTDLRCLCARHCSKHFMSY